MTSFQVTPEMLLEHRAFMRAVARDLLSDDHRAEDVVQDASLAALKSGPRTEEKLRPWLARVIRNLALNIRRSEGRRKTREEAGARAEATPSAHEIFERFTVQREVVDALLTLKEPQQRVLYLHYYEGLPPRDIAKRLDIPVETVRSRLRRSLEALRKELDGKVDGGRDAWCGALAFFAGVRPAPRTTLLTLPKLAAVGAFFALASGVAWWSHQSTGVRLPPRVSAPLQEELTLSAAPVAFTRTALASDVSDSSTALEIVSERVPVHGRVLDVRTAEPVPQLSIVIVEDGREHRVRTDADGRFETEPVSRSDARLSLVDGVHEASVAFHTSGDDRELTLHADLGPTYTFDAVCPAACPGATFNAACSNVTNTANGSRAVRRTFDGRRRPGFGSRRHARAVADDHGNAQRVQDRTLQRRSFGPRHSSRPRAARNLVHSPSPST